MNSNKKIGFIGAGIMGQGMVQNLLKAGNAVSIIANKNRRPIDELVALGANEVLSLADMVSCCNSFILCLPSSATAISVCDELFPLLIPETLIIEMKAQYNQSGVLLPKKQFSKNDNVRLVSGPFSNFLATVESIEENQRVWVLIDILGQKTRTLIKAEKLKHIAN